MKKKRKQGVDAGPAVTLPVRIQPRASRNEIVSMEGGGVKIRLTAPPVDGAANEALVRLLADALSVPKSAVEIVSGHASRDKVIRVSGIGEGDVKRLLNKKSK